MKKIFYIFLLVIFLPVFVSCSDREESVMHDAVISQKKVDKTPVEEKKKKIVKKINKEQLVGEDVGRGSPIAEPIWCGNSALILSETDIGIVLLDIETGNKTTVINVDDAYLSSNCTPDGKWAVYQRYIFIPNPEFEGHEGLDKYEYPLEIPVAEVFRYEVATGTEVKLATSATMSPFYDLISPDGDAILLAPIPSPLVTPPVKIHKPWLLPRWFSEEWWHVIEIDWFKDSSGMVAITSNSFGVGIGVEFFGEDGWSKLFDLAEEYGSISDLAVDGDNGIYFTTYPDIPAGSNAVANEELYRCNIIDKELSCKKVFEFEGISRYVILPGGDIVFQALYENCIRRAVQGRQGSECIFDLSYNGEEYGKILLGSLSPDGRRLVFQRSEHSKVDLFVMDISDF